MPSRRRAGRDAGRGWLTPAASFWRPSLGSTTVISGWPWAASAAVVSADGAGTEDDHTVSGLDVRQRDAVQRDGERLGERRGPQRARAARRAAPRRRPARTARRLPGNHWRPPRLGPSRATRGLTGTAGTHRIGRLGRRRPRRRWTTRRPRRRRPRPGRCTRVRRWSPARPTPRGPGGGRCRRPAMAHLQQDVAGTDVGQGVVDHLDDACPPVHGRGHAGREARCHALASTRSGRCSGRAVSHSLAARMVAPGGAPRPR